MEKRMIFSILQIVCIIATIFLGITILSLVALILIDPTTIGISVFAYAGVGTTVFACVILPIVSLIFVILIMTALKDKETGVYQIILPFEMEIWALFANVPDLPPIRRTLASVRANSVTNPFYPFIYRNLPPNIDELPEVERAELKAILKDKILIADHQGKIHELVEGDKVYLGYLRSIDGEYNEANFILNKGGIIEKFSLQMRFGEELNK